MLIIGALVLFFFIISTCFFIVNSNNYLFYSNYFDYKQSNIVNERNFDLWKKYTKYFNQSSWDDLFCFSWDIKVDDNCYFRWYYWFVPPKSKLNIWNFFLKKESSFIFSWTNSIELTIKNDNIKNIYNFTTTWETRKFPLWYYNIYIYNKNKTWEQFFITSKNTEWIKQMPFNSLTYNCNCYDSWDNLKKTDQLQICNDITWCDDTWDYIKTWTIYTWNVLLKINLNIYKNNTKQFKKLFYLSWN